MAVNNFLPFATAGGAAVLSQAAYASVTPANGWGAGILPKERYNKAARQSSVMAHVLGEIIKDAALDALDDGDIPTLKANLIAALQGLFVASTNAGDIKMFGGSVPPSGWLECNGASLLRAGGYAGLFAVIGTAFGSVDGTHFTLPDFRGEFPRGWDHGLGVDAGRSLGSYQAEGLLAHTHTFGGIYHEFATGLSNPNSLSGVSETEPFPGTTGSTGGTETRPRNLAVMFIIKF